MNIHQLIQHCLFSASLVGAVVCLAAVLAYCFRTQLRELHERWLGLGPFGRVVSILAVTVAVLYGGTKAPTNDPPDTVGGGSTNPPPMMCCSPRPQLSVPPQQTEPDVLSTATPTNYTSLLAWHKRGAFSDWQRIDFPDGFAFPHGTNLLTSITLFAWGEIREEVKVRGEGEQRICDHLCSPSPSIVTFPTPLSLEPGVSTCAYGLTPSNTFLIAWQNACVNRDATNRVDASIELFRNGAMATTVIPLSTPTPPTYTYIPAVPPPGYVGSDQDNAWVLAAFPDDYDAITNKGYEAWLMEDKVGINEPNGLYKATITVGSLPDEGPCYLVCGPYKVVVTSPGTYSFPLEVLRNYTAQTYPIALPLTIEYDDGYRGESESSAFGFSAPSRNAPRLMGLSAPYVYPIFMPPSIYGAPLSVQLHEAQGALISLWANISGAVSWAYRSLSGLTELRFSAPSIAEIVEARVEDTVELFLTIDNSEYGVLLSIEDDHSGCPCGCADGGECICGSDCPWCHHYEDNNSEP